MAYIITNGQEYLISNTATTTNIDECFKWDNITKANNVLKVIPQNLRNKGYKTEYIQTKKCTETLSEIPTSIVMSG